MPDHLRSLIVILALAMVVFAFAKAPACAIASTVSDFERRRNLWIAITLTAFLSHNFWIYIVVTAILLLYALRREQNKLAMYFFLLFAVPVIPGNIPGLGIVETLFTVHYVRLLNLLVLFSAFLWLRKQPGTGRLLQSPPDILFACYLVLEVLLRFASDALTNAIRNTIISTFAGSFLVYYVTSRAPDTLPKFRDALMAFVIAAMMLAAVGVFEFVWSWQLYGSLHSAMGVHWDASGFLRRGNVLRASASVDHPLVLGYVMSIALGFYLFLKNSVPNRTVWGLGLALLIAGLIVPVSRGPWVGAAVIVLVFIATGPSPGVSFAKLLLLGALCAPVLFLSPAGSRFIDLLPFVGTAEQGNVSYRALLLQVSLEVIMQNPFFGNANYLSAPEMQVLMQGEGIIDTVNTYATIGLASGLVGLSIFSGFFIVVGASTFIAMRTVTNRDSELYLLGRVLFSILLGVLVAIFTMSPITIVQTVYFCVAGLCVAYVRMVAAERSSEATRPAGFDPLKAGA